MKILISFLFALALISCSDKSPEAINGTASSLPPGSTQTPFADTPEISAVNLFDNNGNLLQSGVASNGQREGNWVEYHPSGLVKSITPYVNDKIEGLMVELSNAGQLERRMSYHNNLLHGDYRVYRYNLLKEERFYQNGKLEGMAKAYYDDGKIMEEGAYKNGTRDGLSRWYDQNGNVTIEYTYKNGQLIKN